MNEINNKDKDEDWGWFIVIDEEDNTNIKKKIYYNNIVYNNDFVSNDEPYYKNIPQKYYITSMLVYIMSLFV